MNTIQNFPQNISPCVYLITRRTYIVTRYSKNAHVFVSYQQSDPSAQ